MKKLSLLLLVFIETVFLIGFGWKRTKRSIGKTKRIVWFPPIDYYWLKKRGQEHGHDHAVNSQKAAIRNQDYYQFVMGKSEKKENYTSMIIEGPNASIGDMTNERRDSISDEQKRNEILTQWKLTLVQLNAFSHSSRKTYPSWLPETLGKLTTEVFHQRWDNVAEMLVQIRERLPPN